MQYEEVLRELKAIVGEESATDNEIVLVPYSYDTSELSTPARPAGRGDFVALPETIEQIQKIMKLADKEKMPVTPAVLLPDMRDCTIPIEDVVPIWFTDSKLGSNRGGPAIPVEGGIVLDLHRMNKIIEINEDDYYAVVEPGVSVETLECELRARGLCFPIPMSPPNASPVAANLLLAGSGHFSTKTGCQADLINGLEAVLPTGEVVRGGSCAFADSWHAKGPIPDVTGLFTGWQSMTGVVTKIGLKLYKKPPFQMSVGLGFDDYREAINNCMIPFHRMDIAHDISGANWSYHHIQDLKDPVPPRPAEDPLMYVYMSLWGNTEEELNFKKKMLDDFINSQIEAGAFTSYKGIVPGPDITEIPYNIANPKSCSDFRCGGGAWTGYIMPASHWAKAMPELDRIMTSYGVQPSTSCTLLAGSHQGMIRCRWGYDSDNWVEINHVLEMSKELLQVIIDHKGQMYKAPVWATEIMLKNADPGYKKLLHRVKKMLDPNNIMNPGRWGM